MTSSIILLLVPVDAIPAPLVPHPNETPVMPLLIRFQYSLSPSAQMVAVVLLVSITLILECCQLSAMRHSESA